MRLILATLTLWVGCQFAQSAAATVSGLQERRAEAICKVDPAACGARR
jgi:hypothetical protein